MSMKGSKRRVVVPAGMLLTGTSLFSGIIFYEKFTKDAQFHSLIKFGGTSTIFGWLAMMTL